MANIPKNEPEEMNIEFQSLISSYLVTIFPKDLHKTFLDYIKFEPISCKDFEVDKIMITNVSNDNRLSYNILYNYFGNTYKQLYLHTQWLKLDIHICMEKIYYRDKIPYKSMYLVLNHN